MLDLSPFRDDKFDAKRWINAACKSRHLQDGVESHLSDLEMKLQMASEEIASSLEDQSTASPEHPVISSVSGMTSSPSAPLSPPSSSSSIRPACDVAISGLGRVAIEPKPSGNPELVLEDEKEVHFSLRVPRQVRYICQISYAGGQDRSRVVSISRNDR